MYSYVINEQGSPLSNCIGFLYCPKLQMNRPGGANSIQRIFYSRHKLFHCLIYQTFTTPDGLILNMSVPIVDRRHDIKLYRQSNMDQIFQQNILINGQKYCFYGDPDYIM